MYLPVVQGTADAVAIAADPSVDTVLIVEDEPDVMEDILFTDIVMPKGISGIQLARPARELRPDLKVVVASGYPLPALREQYGRIDDFAFVKKSNRLADSPSRLGLPAKGCSATLRPTYTVGHRPLRKARTGRTGTLPLRLQAR
jgi:CheY-like chemotaxis protein